LSQPLRADVIESDIVNEQATKLWRALCIEAAFEENPEKLPQIIAKLNSGLTARQEQLAEEIFERLGSDPPNRPSAGKWIH
jgi:phage terminase large subunit-like protein